MDGPALVREGSCFTKVALGRDEGGFTFAEGRDDDCLVLVSLLEDVSDCGRLTLGSLHLRFCVEAAREGGGCFRAKMGELVPVSLYLRFLVDDAGEEDGCFTTDGLSLCSCFLVEDEETGGGLSVEIDKINPIGLLK